MNNKIIIGIDGISYAGKTTVCNEIEKTNKDIVIVSESPKFANKEIHISTSNNSILENAKVTLEIEKRRTIYVKDFLDKELFLFDRSVFSFLAISYAYYKTKIINYFNDYVDNIINGIEAGEYLVPDYLLYLSISSEELKRRMQIHKKHLPDYWTSEVFNDSIDEILKIVNDFYTKNKRSISKEELFQIEASRLTKIEKERVVELIRSLKI